MFGACGVAGILLPLASSRTPTVGEHQEGENDGQERQRISELLLAGAWRIGRLLLLDEPGHED